MSLRGLAYRTMMRVAHRFNWHYAPPIYPENDTQLWCKWCGFRMTLPKNCNLTITAEAHHAKTKS